MPRVRHPVATPDLRDVAKRQTGRVAQVAQRHVLTEREHLAPELTRVIDVFCVWLPLRPLALPLAHGGGAADCCGSAVGWVGVCGS